jgi:hypothetical protein
VKREADVRPQAKRLKLARPMIRRDAGFDTGHAPRQLLEESQHAAALELPTKDDFASASTPWT